MWMRFKMAIWTHNRAALGPDAFHQIRNPVGSRYAKFFRQ